MADYKMVNTEQLETDLTAVAELIREKSGEEEKLAFPEGFLSGLQAIPLMPDGVTSFVTELAGGVLCYDEDTSGISVRHTLSGVPKGVFVYREGSTISGESYLNWAMIYPYYYYNTSSGVGFNGVLHLSVGGVIKSVYDYTNSVNATLFRLYGNSYTPALKAGINYHWLAWR